jgi:hypothetical protein
MSLTHSCALIRSEFRSIWLSCHRIPLCSLEGYLKVFFPTPSSKAEVQGTLSSYGTSGGSLRVWVRNTELANRDLRKLLKHKMRFPDCTIQFQGQSDVDEGVLQALQRITDNKDPTWTKWLKGNVITQVRWNGDRGVLPTRIIIKERYAPLWMRKVFQQDELLANAFAKDIGLQVVLVGFGVDYS